LLSDYRFGTTVRELIAAPAVAVIVAGVDLVITVCARPPGSAVTVSGCMVPAVVAKWTTAAPTVAPLASFTSALTKIVPALPPIPATACKVIVDATCAAGGREFETDRQMAEEFVAECIREFTGPGADGAWHRLIEAGPGIVPSIVRALEFTEPVPVRVMLVRGLSEHRVPETAQCLGDLLTDDEAQVWKAALDALVSIGGSQALAVLRRAKDAVPVERQFWIVEAVGQIEEA
jgi:HEAT repeats